MNLQAVWLRRGLIARSLLPLSWVYGALVWIHRFVYRIGLLRATKMHVPVVVVGNAVAGGAGKTPVVMALVKHLQDMGLRPGVISRGYGRTEPGCREVSPTSGASQVGDEPLLIARLCQVPVAVAERRADAARLLLARHPQLQVLVSDDGLQHRALHADLRICVLDDRGTANGYLLPAGPLREPWPQPVDLVLRPLQTPDVTGFAMTRCLAPEAVRADGGRQLLATLAGEQVLAVAGIARPQKFFEMLGQAGVVPAQCLGLADHHDFDAHPILVPPGQVLVCTEKDAVKLWRTHPQAWAVPLQLQIDPAFWQALAAWLAAKLSSPDGSQTARTAGVPGDQGAPGL